MEEQKKMRKRKKIQRQKELVYSAKARVANAVTATAGVLSGAAVLNFQQLWK